jgi:hypothetical protein
MYWGALLSSDEGLYTLKLFITTRISESYTTQFVVLLKLLIEVKFYVFRTVQCSF